MSLNFYRFYIYPDQDADSFEPFALKLKEEGFSYYSQFIPWEENKKGKYFYFMKIPKVQILCLRADLPHSSEKEIIDLLYNIEDIEKRAEAGFFNLLGKIEVFSSIEKDETEITKHIKNIVSFNEQKTIELKLKHGRGRRLDWLWPEDKAFYVFSFKPEVHEAQYFVEFDLPCIEASLLRLDRINSYYREQKRLILKEKEGLDQRLSRILHSNTVSASTHAQQMEEFENQLHTLASSFGIIAGDYSIILEGASRIRQMTNYSRYLMDKQKEIEVDDTLYEKIFDYYFTKLKDMENLAEGLRISRENYQAAINVIRSKLDILISHENINTQNQIKNIMELNTSIQKQGLIFQFAAGLVEFIVLAYYSHSLWKALAYNAYHMVPGWLQFIITCIFSGTTVYLTHLIAEYIQGEKHHRRRIILLSIFLLLMLICIFTGSFILDNKVH